MVILAFGYVLVLGFILNLLARRRRFDRQRNAIAHRIHVNGIRGKSTVTRYVAAILRDAGLETYGKTTGTAARVILPSGEDALIKRRGQANVSEQLRMIRSFADRGAQAVVVECMAINPDYQDWLEAKVMHSSIVIITNVRLDHQEEMGRGLTDIARSLARSIPRDGLLITAETNPEVLEILETEAAAKGTRLVMAPTSAVHPASLRRFSHVAHAGNVAVGLAIAELFGIDRQRALAAMVAAGSDPGAFSIQTFEIGGKTVRWANLFAVNDQESFAEITAGLAKRFRNHHRVAILNNRLDRPSRVEMFSGLAQKHLRAGTIVALGDYERRVQKSIQSKAVNLRLMGNTSRYARSDGQALLEEAVAGADTDQVLMVGAANIHTQQSEGILHYIAGVTQAGVHEAPLATYRTARHRRRPLAGLAALSTGLSRRPERTDGA